MLSCSDIYFMNNTQLRKAKEILLSLSQGAVGLFVNIIILIVIERAYNEAGLGIFSYLFSLYVISGFITEFGVAGLVERETAIDNEEKEIIIRDVYCTLFWVGLFFSGLFISTAAFNTYYTRVNENRTV